MLATLPGDWSWLGDHVEADDLREVFEALGRKGFVALLGYNDDVWSLYVIRSLDADVPTFDDCLLEALELLKDRA